MMTKTKPSKMQVRGSDGRTSVRAYRRRWERGGQVG